MKLQWRCTCTAGGGPRGSTGVHGGPRPHRKPASPRFFFVHNNKWDDCLFSCHFFLFFSFFFLGFFLNFISGVWPRRPPPPKPHAKKVPFFFFLLRPLFFLFLSFCFYVSHVETYFDSSSADGFLIYIYSQWFLSFFFFFFFLFYFEFNRRRRCRPLSLSFVVVCWFFLVYFFKLLFPNHFFFYIWRSPEARSLNLPDDVILKVTPRENDPELWLQIGGIFSMMSFGFHIEMNQVLRFDGETIPRRNEWTWFSTYFFVVAIKAISFNDLLWVVSMRAAVLLVLFVFFWGGGDFVDFLFFNKTWLSVSIAIRLGRQPLKLFAVALIGVAHLSADRVAPLPIAAALLGPDWIDWISCLAVFLFLFFFFFFIDSFAAESDSACCRVLSAAYFLLLLLLLLPLSSSPSLPSSSDDPPAGLFILIFPSITWTCHCRPVLRDPPFSAITTGFFFFVFLFVLFCFHFARRLLQ